ncbi:MAG: cupin domain-containing protein, partial [Verrucomicrobiae bacterium]|nr:cupin domain-containing protein [Verrucomicrobiae bacterium]
GEIIYELVGLQSEARNEIHSVAHITLPPGTGAARHYHPEAEESYTMISGTAQMLLGDEESILAAGDCVVIKANTPHKIWNHTDENVVFIATCVPAWREGNSVYLE